ncbi:MAG: group 1 truncated hemoglobin [Candidatus Hydrogenedentes bacterium]|nr:group 1 truncated hemoglobin [Candidatus Hydrogenedentota bacterium]
METLYIRLGGEHVIEKAVDLLYSKVRDDKSLAPFFEGLDMPRQKRMFRLFLNTVTEGPLGRVGVELRSAHAHAVNEGLSQQHMVSFLEHLRSAFTELKLEPDVVEGVVKLLASYSDDVLGL